MSLQKPFTFKASPLGCCILAFITGYFRAVADAYEPELFPGLVYRLVEPKIVLLIFVSGKIVITGAKNSEMMKDGLMKVYPLLLPFRKSSVILNV